MTTPVPSSETDPIASLSALHVHLATGRSNACVTGMKPRVLLECLEKASRRPVPLELHMPPSGIGSVSLIEAAMLVCLVRLLQPARIVEFGTFRGYSTALLLRNAPPACEVLSLDLGAVGDDFSGAASYTAAELRTDHRKNDDYLRHVQSAEGRFYLSDLPAEQLARLRLLTGDSRAFDVAAHGLDGKVDLIFIDGGHDYATIASDTRKAHEMASGRAIIVWHDFRSGIHGEVTAFIDDYARDKAVFHVQNTMLAVEFVGTAAAVLSAPDTPAGR